MQQGPAHILVVDDKEPIRITMRELLQRRGYEVTTAEHGEAAQPPLTQVLIPKYYGVGGQALERKLHCA